MGDSLLLGSVGGTVFITVWELPARQKSGQNVPFFSLVRAMLVFPGLANRLRKLPGFGSPPPHPAAYPAGSPARCSPLLGPEAVSLRQQRDTAWSRCPFERAGIMAA